MNTSIVVQRHRTSGFTLVEAVVVAVIMGILAAVAIPMYLGYIQDQRQSTVNNLAETAATAANAFLRRTGSDPSLAQLNLYYNASKYSVSVNGGANTVTVTEINNGLITATATY